PLSAANQTRFSSKGSMARMLKLSINTGVISTELNSISVLLSQEKRRNTVKTVITKRMDFIFFKSNDSKIPNHNPDSYRDQITNSKSQITILNRISYFPFHI